MVPAKRLRQLNRKITHLFYIYPSSAACSTVRGGIFARFIFHFPGTIFSFLPAIFYALIRKSLLQSL